jgi:hypothetical protein
MSINQTETTFETSDLNVQDIEHKLNWEFYNVFSKDFQITCLTETSLNDICFDHKMIFRLFHYLTL